MALINGCGASAGGGGDIEKYANLETATGGFDLSSIVPGYNQLTLDNFIIEVISMATANMPSSTTISTSQNIKIDNYYYYYADMGFLQCDAQVAAGSRTVQGPMQKINLYVIR